MTTFSLLELSTSELNDIAASRAPAGLQQRLEAGALPPAFVAARSLLLADSGHPAPWSTTFLVVDNASGRIVGGCGFKTAPHHGRVDVGYAIAPVARGKGAATAAVQWLTSKAFEAGATEVLAEVAPTNHASTRVVQKAGFAVVGARVDNADEYLVQWLKRCMA